MNKLISTALYWKMFIVKACLSSVITIAGAIMAALAGVDWSQLSKTQKLIVICGIVVVTGKNLESLIDKTFSNLQKGVLPDLGDPNSTVDTVTATASVSSQVNTQPVVQPK